MIGKNKIKFINSLKIKKFRDIHGLFIAEGDKMVSDLSGSNVRIRMLIGTNKWLSNNVLHADIDETTESDENEIKKISTLQTVPEVLAVCYKPDIGIEIEKTKSGLSLYLDTIQDPGNLGTIIRTAAWFGIETVFCSKNCADVYNPKSVQATMGAVYRVQVHYVETKSFFKKLKSFNVPVYGAMLNGNNIYAENLSTNGIIVLGNESKGISGDLLPWITHKLFIPGFPGSANKTESLNVSGAAAVICSEFRRRQT